MALACASLAFGLLHLRGRGIERRLLGIVVGLGNQLVVVQRLVALIVELGALVLGLRLVQVGGGGVHRGLRRHGVGARGVQGRLHGGNVGRGLNVVQRGQHLALLHPVAFLHVQLGDLAQGVGADVDVHFGLDLARGGDH